MNYLILSYFIWHGGQSKWETGRDGTGQKREGSEEGGEGKTCPCHSLIHLC